MPTSVATSAHFVASNPSRPKRTVAASRMGHSFERLLDEALKEATVPGLPSPDGLVAALIGADRTTVRLFVRVVPAGPLTMIAPCSRTEFTSLYLAWRVTGRWCDGREGAVVLCGGRADSGRRVRAHVTRDRTDLPGIGCAQLRTGCHRD